MEKQPTFMMWQLRTSWKGQGICPDQRKPWTTVVEHSYDYRLGSHPPRDILGKLARPQQNKTTQENRL